MQNLLYLHALKMEKIIRRFVFIMEHKDYFLEIAHIDAQIFARREQLSYLHKLLCKLKECGTGRDIRDTARKIKLLHKTIAEDIKRLTNSYENIRKIILEINNKEHSLILEMKYINMLTFDKIAEETGYCRRHVLRLHEKALIELRA